MRVQSPGEVEMMKSTIVYLDPVRRFANENSRLRLASWHAVALAAICCLSGCILFRNDTRNVSRDMRYWGDTRPNDVYRLEREVFMVGFENQPATRLFTPGDKNFDVPATVEKYWKNLPEHQLQQKFVNVHGVLAVGT